MGGLIACDLIRDSRCAWRVSLWFEHNSACATRHLLLFWNQLSLSIASTWQLHRSTPRHTSAGKIVIVLWSAFFEKRITRSIRRRVYEGFFKALKWNQWTKKYGVATDRQILIDLLHFYIRKQDLLNFKRAQKMATESTMTKALSRLLIWGGMG